MKLSSYRGNIIQNGDKKLQKSEVIEALTPETPKHKEMLKALGFDPDVIKSQSKPAAVPDDGAENVECAQQ